MPQRSQVVLEALRVDRVTLGVVADHVGGGDHPGQAIGAIGVMALDRDGDPLRQVPAPRQHAADQRVVDPELLALVAEALLRGPRGGVEVGLVTGVKARDHQPADVVEQGDDGEVVALREPGHPGDLIGGPLGRQSVDAEVLGAQLPAAIRLEEVIDRGGAGDRQHPGGLQHVERVRNVGDASGGPRAAVGEAQHGDRQGDIGLDRLDDLAHP